MKHDWIKWNTDTAKSSLWLEDAVTLKVFLYFVMESDANGRLKATHRALVDGCRITGPEFDRSMEVLTSPDPDSTNEDHGGRRILIVEPNVYQVVSKQKYNPPRPRRPGDSTPRVQKYREQHETPRNAGNALEEKRGEEKRKEKKERRAFVAPTLDEVQAFIAAEGYRFVSAKVFWNYYDETGWRKANGRPVKDWKKACRGWNDREEARGTPAIASRGASSSGGGVSRAEWERALAEERIRLEAAAAATTRFAAAQEAPSEAPEAPPWAEGEETR